MAGVMHQLKISESSANGENNAIANNGYQSNNQSASA
jgi:hypothetical protein